MDDIARATLMAARGKPCPWCGQTMTRRHRHPTRDRLHPGKLGGSYVRENVAIVCHPCNNSKAHLTLAQFLAALIVVRDPRWPRVAVFILARAVKGVLL